MKYGNDRWTETTIARDVARRSINDGPFPLLVLSLQCNVRWLRENFGLKLQNTSEFLHIHARSNCNATHAHPTCGRGYHARFDLTPPPPQQPPPQQPPPQQPPPQQPSPHTLYPVILQLDVMVIVNS